MEEEAGRTYTGNHHPATSWEAALSVAESAANLRERVFRAIEAAGAAGLTRDEIEVCCRMLGSTVRPRVKELQEQGRVEETLMQRKTRSGRNAYVLVAAQATVEMLPSGVRRDERGGMVLDLEFTE